VRSGDAKQIEETKQMPESDEKKIFDAEAEL
jgi:hypothetical protein